MTTESNAPGDKLDSVRSDTGRLEAVHDTGLLDTPAEETFDALSRLAVALIGAPVSFLSIVDEKRDFYKSQCGLPEPLATERQLSGRTFCHYALSSSGPLIIDDTHSSSVWRSVPTVDTLGVRAYLGVPVIVAGHAIGSFCVIDSQPHCWSSTAVETLVQISKAAAREIELRASLKTTKAEVERANKLAKSNAELLAIVVHDLRSPLQTIRLGVTALGRLAEPQHRSLIERVTRAADSMKQLLDDSLLTYAAKSDFWPRRTPIAAATLLKDSVETMQLVAERSAIGVSVQCDTSAEISVDYAQMLRVLGNLIGNCIKYCPAGSTVVLSAERHDGHIEIVVSDDGPGMTAEDQERAFERGWQGDEGRTRQDGVGLGLSIVRELVSQNGGSVSLSSRIGLGTTVKLRLPMVQ